MSFFGFVLGGALEGTGRGLQLQGQADAEAQAEERRFLRQVSLIDREHDLKSRGAGGVKPSTKPALDKNARESNDAAMTDLVKTFGSSEVWTPTKREITQWGDNESLNEVKLTEEMQAKANPAFERYALDIRRWMHGVNGKFHDPEERLELAREKGATAIAREIRMLAEEAGVPRASAAAVVKRVLNLDGDAKLLERVRGLVSERSQEQQGRMLRGRRQDDLPPSAAPAPATAPAGSGISFSAIEADNEAPAPPQMPAAPGGGVFGGAASPNFSWTQQDEPAPGGEAAERLREFEGFKPTAYKDGDGRSIGYGTQLPLSSEELELIGKRDSQGLAVTREQADKLLDHRLSAAVEEVNQAFPWASSLSPQHAAALYHMVYQMGLTKVRSFKDMLAALQRGDTTRAASAALNSDWAKQTPDRAKYVASLLRG